MAGKITFFTIAFVDEDTKVTSLSVVEFFKKLEKEVYGLDTINRKNLLLRQIGDESVYIFRYYWNEPSNSRFSIPIGKVKTKDLPVIENPSTFEPENVNGTLFEMSVILYDVTENIFVLFSHRGSPSVNLIEDYLNTFLPKDFHLRIRIQPIIINKGIEAVRSASMVRSICLSLNLSEPINDFYNTAIENNRSQSLLQTVKQMATASKEINTKAFNIELGLDRKSKQSDSLDYNSILALLNELDLDSEIISEVSVRYKNGEKEPVDLAKMKNSSIQVFHYFKGEGGIGAEFLLHNFDEVVEKQRTNYLRARSRYFTGIIPTDESYSLRTKWNPSDYYE